MPTFLRRTRFKLFKIWPELDVVGYPPAYLAGRSGGATPGHTRSNDLDGRSTALPIALLQ